MAKYDGSIRIIADVEIVKAEQELKALESSMRNVANRIENMKKRMDSLSKSKLPTSEYRELQKEAEKLEKKLLSVYDRQEKFLAIRGKEDSKPYERMVFDAERLEKELTSVEAKMKRLEESGRAFVAGSKTDEYLKLSADIEKARVSLLKLNEERNRKTDKLYEMRSMIMPQNAASSGAESGAESSVKDTEKVFKSTMQRILDTFKNFPKTMSQLVKKMGSALVNGIKSLPKTLGNIAKSIGSAFVKGLSGATKAIGRISASIGKGLVSTFSKMSSLGKRAFSSLTDSSNKSSKSFKSGLFTILKYTVGIRSLFVLTNRFRNALMEGTKNMAQYSDSYNKTLSMMKSANTQMKNSFATAFAPIVEIIAPYLTMLMNMITQVSNKIAQFFSLLAGKSTWTKAVAVQEDYAASLGKTEKAAKKAAGALASFDTLEVLSKKDNADSGSGGGGSVSPKDMFKEEKIDSSIKNTFDNLKEMITNEDWEGLGSYIATGINNGFEKLYEFLNWKNIGPKIVPVINAVTKTFNSLVDGINWDLIGRTVGTGINTIVKAVRQLITGIDWKNLGASIGTAINGLFDEIEWDTLGDTIAEGINAITGYFNALFETIDFVAIGADLAEGLNSMIKGVDWEAVGVFLMNKLNAAIDILYGIVTKFDWANLGDSLGTMLNGAIKSIKPKKWAKTLSELVKGIFDTIINFLNTTDWQEIGRKIAVFIANVDWTGMAEKLFEGIGAALASIYEFFYGLLSGAWNKVVDWWYNTAFEDGQFTMKGLLLGIAEAFANIGFWIKDHIFKPFIDGFCDAFNIHSPSKEMATYGGHIITGLLNGIVNGIKGIGTWIKTNIFEPIANGFKSAFNFVGGVAQSMLGFGSAIIGGLKSGIEKGVSGVKVVINSVLGFIEKMVNGVISGINLMINALNKLSIDIPDWVPVVGGKNLGFSIPELGKVSLPRLATGAVIRGGNPFMAVLGDQPSGQTNIEAPLATIRQAVREEISGMGFGYGDNVNLTVNGVLNGDTLMSFTVDNLFAELNRRGYDTSVLGGGVIG